MKSELLPGGRWLLTCSKDNQSSVRCIKKTHNPPVDEVNHDRLFASITKASQSLLLENKGAISVFMYVMNSGYVLLTKMLSYLKKRQAQEITYSLSIQGRPESRPWDLVPRNLVFYDDLV